MRSRLPDLFDSAETGDARSATELHARRLNRELRRPVEHSLEEISSRVRRLMDDLGEASLGSSLRSLGWAFGFDRAKTRLGCCTWSAASPADKRITLSRHFAQEYGWPLMEDVARHEIAHALDVETRGTTDHGPNWKRWATRCGADPRRLYEGEGPKRLKPKYVAECPVCGEMWPYYRRSRVPIACLACCRRHNGGSYAPRFRLRFHDARKHPGRQLRLFGAEGATVP